MPRVGKHFSTTDKEQLLLGNDHSIEATPPVNFLAGIKPRRPALAGCVALVGAGPGDADLLTVKALQWIKNSDVIFYDRLVSEEIRALFPSHVAAIYVGKAKSRHTVSQEALNSLLVRAAQQGLQVCRLKGGDPFVFGRGGEEMLELKAASVPVEVVPGITSGAGATAYAGIPLTHRGLTQGVSFVTAHGETDLHANWSALASSGHTLVFYMGLGSAELIAEKLVAAGLSVETPTAIIERGCTRAQRVLRASLRDMPALAHAENVTSPALIVVGQVVSLRDQLQWWPAFESESISVRCPDPVSDSQLTPYFSETRLSA